MERFLRRYRCFLHEVRSSWGRFLRFWRSLTASVHLPYSFYWSDRTVKVASVAAFVILLSAYLYWGFQPNVPVDAMSYPRLIIPSISLETPVEGLELNNRQLNVPDMIAGSYSAEQNKTLIVGHSSTVFEDLGELSVGREVIFDERAYEIVNIEIAEKSKISMTKVLAGSETDTIILMTCAGDPLPNQDATHRLMVTAKIK